MSDIPSIVTLSDLLAELSNVKRATKLPNGEYETDSHHSFSLALIAYHLCDKYDLKLNREKLLLFALAHDLLEIVTGDEDTLHSTAAQLEAKRQKEEQAMTQFNKLFAQFPGLIGAMHEYEKLDTPEAATIFVLDKACTTWTHFHDEAHHLRTERNIVNSQDVAGWADRQRTKFNARLQVNPPQIILDIYEDSFAELQRFYKD